MKELATLGGSLARAAASEGVSLSVPWTADLLGHSTRYRSEANVSVRALNYQPTSDLGDLTSERYRRSCLSGGRMGLAEPAYSWCKSARVDIAKIAKMESLGQSLAAGYRQ